MKEITPTFPDLSIDYDARYPESPLHYPFVNVLSTPQGSELIAISVRHFNGTTMTDHVETENWQFPIFGDLLKHAVHALPELPTVAFNEGRDRTQLIDMQDSIEAALLREGDPGMFTWVMKKHNIPVGSWDLSMTQEVSRLLWLYTHGDTPSAEILRNTWPSLQKFKQYIGYFEFGKHTPQYLRQRAEEHQNASNVALEGLHTYVRSRLDSQDIIGLTKLGIDISQASLQAIHEEVCADAGVDLPLNPSTAPQGTYSPGEYMHLHFPPTNAAPGDYFASQTDLQLLGGIVGRKIRNEHLANLLSRQLSIPQRVIVAAGGRHVVEALRIMHDDTERRLPLTSLETYIGEAACRDYIQRDHPKGGYDQ